MKSQTKHKNTSNLLAKKEQRVLSDIFG